MYASRMKFLLPAVLALGTMAASAEVTISEPWIRGMVTGQSATGAFMAISSNEATALVGASSPVASKVEIHQMSMDQGVMKMRPLDRLQVPANGTVRLEPGGYHVMLIGVAKPLAKGDKVPLTLQFQGKDGKKTSKEIMVEVRDIAAQSDMKMPMK